MNIGELKDLLDGFDDDLEVMVAHQPGWPLRENIGDVTSAATDPYCADEDDENIFGEKDNCVYIVASGQPYDKSPYAPRWIFDS